jgi:hypothetical protein
MTNKTFKYSSNAALRLPMDVKSATQHVKSLMLAFSRCKTVCRICPTIPMRAGASGRLAHALGTFKTTARKLSPSNHEVMQVHICALNEPALHPLVQRCYCHVNHQIVVLARNVQADVAARDIQHIARPQRCLIEDLGAWRGLKHRLKLDRRQRAKPLRCGRCTDGAFLCHLACATMDTRSLKLGSLHRITSTAMLAASKQTHQYHVQAKANDMM